MYNSVVPVGPIITIIVVNRCTVLMHTDQYFYNRTGGQVVKVWDFHVGGPGSIPGPASIFRFTS